MEGFRQIKALKNANRFKGQALIELLIAIALSGIMIPAVFAGLGISSSSKQQETQRLEATNLLKESQEAVRSVRESGWANIATNGIYHPEISGSIWILAPNAQTVNGYTRQVLIEDTHRLNGQIVTAGGQTDPSTKKVTITVSWTAPYASSVESVNYYQRYLNNAVWTQTTSTDFSAGTFNNTWTVGSGTSASVELTQTGSQSDYGNKFRLDSFGSVVNMSSTSTRTSLRFSAKNTKTLNAVRVYLNTEVGTSPTYSYGLQADNAGNPTGTWLCSNTLQATSIGWKTINLSGCPQLTAGNTYHIVIQHQSGTVSPSRHISIRNSSPNNLLHPFDNSVNTASNTLFSQNSGSSWTIQNAQPIYEIDFTDGTYEGNPYYGQLITIPYGQNYEGEKFTYTGPTQSVQSLTFYIGKQGSPPGNLEYVIEEIGGSLSVCTLTPSQIGTALSSVTCTFSPLVPITQNSQYRVYARSPSSPSPSDSYVMYRLLNDNLANFNSINYGGINSVYTTGNGFVFSENPDTDIGGFYLTLQGASGYSTSGEFTSQASTGLSNVAFNYLTWNATTPPQTSVSLQLSVDGGPYFGSDGTDGSFFTVPAAIPLNKINGSTVRFKATLTSDGSATPSLNDVTLNYSP